MTGYAEKKRELLFQLSRSPDEALFGIAKRTSNLFRDRRAPSRLQIDLKDFNRVVGVDTAAGTLEVEGMTPYVDVVRASLPLGVMPCVVPQLKSITVGGAVSGVGIESTSFRQGLVHDGVVALEVLTGDGRLLTCTPENEQSDLFYGFANSYGTLGYALKVTVRTLPIRPFVRLEHLRYTDPAAYFAAIEQRSDEAAVDFLDATVFAPDEMYLTLGRFADTAPYVSDYTYQHIYYRSIRGRASDYLTIHDYLWRWDTDWFWCSKHLGAQNFLVRRLLGRARLNSVTYQRIMRWNSKWQLTHSWYRLRGRTPESVIQDVDIPIDRAPEFLAFLHREIGILPIWICPIRAPAPEKRFDLYPLTGAKLYINFGFWDVVRDREARPTGYHNRNIERKVSQLGGIKSLYSDSYYDEEEFWAIYNGKAYAALKQKYDPQRKLGDLYQKCVAAAKKPAHA